MGVTRRGVLIGAGVLGGLAALYTFVPRNFDAPLGPGEDEIAFDAWIKIARDGVVTIAVPQLEMGQGVTTLIPQIIAMELGADWRQIAVEPAPVAAAYPNIPLAKQWASLWDPLAAGLSDTTDDMLAEREVVDAIGRRRVHDARAVLGAHKIGRHHSERIFGIDVEIVEQALVARADEL